MRLNPAVLAMLSMNTEQHIQANKNHVKTFNLEDSYCIDSPTCTTNEQTQLKYKLDMLFVNKQLSEDNSNFYALPQFQYQILQQISMRMHGKNASCVEFRGNYFTSEIYIKNYPFHTIQKLKLEL